TVAAFGVAEAATMSFDKQMSASGAAADATAGQYDDLREAALQAGKDTAFSATEAAAGEEELAKAGIGVADITNGALAGALDLAAAGNISVADAASDAATAMVDFKLSGRDVPHVADLLAAAAGKAQGDVGDMAQAMKFVGPVAAGMGVSLEQTVGTLALFATHGLIADQAGTSLRGVLSALTSPSKQAADVMAKLGISVFDSSGQFVGLDGVAGQLHTSLAGLTEQQRSQALGMIFGNEQLSAARVLYESGAEGVDKWTRSVNDAGFAQDQASARMDNLSGDLEQLKGSIETALIQEGSGATDVLRGLAQHTGNVVDGFLELPEPLQETAAGIAGVTGATLGLLGIVGTVAPKVQAARESLRGMGEMGVRADKALGVAGKTLGASIPVLAVAGVALDIWAQHQAAAKQRVDDFVSALRADNDVVGTNTRQLAAHNLEQAGALKAAQDLGISLEDVTSAALGNSAAMASVNEQLAPYIAQADMTASAGDTVTGATQNWSKEVGTLREALGGQNKDLADAMEASKRQAEATGHATEATDAQTVASQAASVSLQDEKSAADQLKDSLDALNGKNITAEEAAISYQQAIDDATQSIDDNGKTLDINTDAGRKNMSALIDQAKSAQDYAQAVLDQTGNQAQSNKVLADARTALMKVAEQAGLTKGEAKKLVDQYLQTPQVVKTRIDIEAAAAKKALDEVDNKLNGLKDRTVTLNVRTKYSDPGTSVRTSSGLVGRAGGGPVYGPGTSTSDDVPAMLSNGEFVLQASAVDRYGLDFLGRLNRGMVRAFAGGGYVQHASVASTMTLSGIAPAPAVSVPVNVYAPPGMPLEVLAHKVSRILGGAPG
ncbi:MAG TPA: phage tail tape measure protein, partial [Mycobacteriales bacterium]